MREREKNNYELIKLIVFEYRIKLFCKKKKDENIEVFINSKLPGKKHKLVPIFYTESVNRCYLIRSIRNNNTSNSFVLRFSLSNPVHKASDSSKENRDKT